MKPKLKIGDWVSICSTGGFYSSYHEMALKMNLEHWKTGVYPDESLKYQVIDIRHHEYRHSGWVIAIQSLPTGLSQYLFSPESLKKIKNPYINDFLLKDEDFELL
jgi:hypothetical protein